MWIFIKSSFLVLEKCIPKAPGSSHHSVFHSIVSMFSHSSLFSSTTRDVINVDIGSCLSIYDAINEMVVLSNLSLISSQP